MFVADPLFGPFVIPDRLDALLRAPEVQRLRDVRLINTTTPGLAAISDVRRFTHTLGVLRLALRVTDRLKRVWPRTTLDTLLVAAALHDVGTPAFAHLFEYILKVTYGFSHEAMLKSIIAGDYKRTNRCHQFYYGGSPALYQRLEELDVDPDDVVACVLGHPPLGPLVAGTIDLDNLDNVYRMAAALGLPADADAAVGLADTLDIDPASGRIVLPRDALGYVDRWRTLRRRCYEVLAFDESALASQAMLTDCLSEAVERRLLTDEDWFLTDEQMLRRLIELDTRAPVALRETVLRFVNADYHSTIFIGWYASGTDRDLRLPAHRGELRGRIEDVLGMPVVPYVFYDKGTFTKRLPLRLTDGDGTVEIGETSSSTVVSVFTSRRIAQPSRKTTDLVQEVLAGYGLHPCDRRPLPGTHDVYELAGRPAPAF